jgi:hypothetical protein
VRAARVALIVAMLAGAARADDAPADPTAHGPQERPGRAASLTGIFLGYAGSGLVVSGALVAGGPPGRPTLDDRQLRAALGLGAGLGAAGALLQGIGSATEAGALRRAGMRHRPVARALAASIGAATLPIATVAVVLAARGEAGAGTWSFGAGGLSLLAATSHTLLLLDGDAARRRPAVALRVSPAAFSVIVFRPTTSR